MAEVKEIAKMLGTMLSYEDLKQIMQSMLESAKELLHLSMGLDELQGVLERKVHGIIIDKEAELNGKFLGGELVFEHVDAANFAVAIRTFFQDAQNKIQESSVKSPKLPLSSLDVKAREELEKLKSVKYEIDEPTKEFREMYLKQKSEK